MSNSAWAIIWLVCIAFTLDHIHHTQKHIEAELALIVQNTGHR